MSVCLTSSSTLLRHTSLLPCNVTHAFHELQSETFFALISKNNWTDDVWVFSDGLDIPVWWKEGSEPLNADKSITDNDNDILVSGTEIFLKTDHWNTYFQLLFVTQMLTIPNPI